MGGVSAEGRRIPARSISTLPARDLNSRIWWASLGITLAYQDPKAAEVLASIARHSSASDMPLTCAIARTVSGIK